MSEKNEVNCVFCDIVNGKIPVKKLFETEKILAFYDIEPKAPVHFLVIPKYHIESVEKLKPNQFSLIQDIFISINEIADKLNLSDGFRIVNNCGVMAGQTVNHIHFHVLSGRKFDWPPG